MSDSEDDFQPNTAPAPGMMVHGVFPPVVQDDDTPPPEFNEITTDQNYRDIEEFELEFSLQEGMEFHPYQKQMITKMLEAEILPPIETERGRFYSRLAVNACMPDSGKTPVTLAVCLGYPEIDQAPISMNTYSSSLVSFELPNDESREYIPTSIVVCPPELAVNAWKKNCEKFFGDDLCYILGTASEIQAQASKSGVKFSNDDEAAMKKRLTSLKNKRKRGTLKDAEIAELDELEKWSAEKKATKTKRVSTSTKARDSGIMEFIVQKMREYRVIICPLSSFQLLFPIFEKYEVSRLILDELQKSTVTKQDDLIGYKINPVMEYLASRTTKRKENTYRELSPARMIWLITATPHQLHEHEKGRWFNTWIGKNAPFLNDYCNAASGKFMFPDVIERYVIKFPNEYIKEQKDGGNVWRKNLTLKVKRPNIVGVLQGVMGDDYDVLLQNDNFEEVMRKLGLDGVGVNDPELELKIIQASIDKLNKDIAEIDYREAGYKTGGNATILAKNEEERNAIRKRIATIERKYNALTTIKEHFAGELEEPISCQICFENIEGEVFACKECWAFTCRHCALTWSKKMGANKQCYKCKTKFHSVKDFGVYKQNADGEVNVEPEIKEELHEDEEENIEDKEFDSKLEAITTVLSDDYGLEKTLMFLNSGDESNNDNTIIRALIDMGLHVFYDNSLTERERIAKFGQRGKDYVHCVANRRKMDKELEKFRDAKKRCVFILKTGSKSTGLDFPFIDAILCYSNFKEGDVEQIVGRAERHGRTKEFCFITLNYMN